MAGVEKMSIALTPEMARAMRDLVAAGEYASTSEVVREAVRDWAFRRQQRAEAVEALRHAWDVGIASGASVDGEEAFGRIQARIMAESGEKS